MANSSLTPAELRALFEILTHYETFAEIQDHKYEKQMEKWGPPLTSTPTKDSPFPLVQMLMDKFFVPGIVPDEVISSYAGLHMRLAKADLSESYDKGYIGLRKTASTFNSAFTETMARWAIAGAPRSGKVPDANTPYNRGSAKDLEKAWNDSIQGTVYGDWNFQAMECLKKSADINSLPPAMLAAMDFGIIQSATLLHHFFVVMPDGQAMLKTMDMLDTITPYAMIKTTMRMANVASIMNGMTKILLAKVNHKNLLQTAMSKTITWDVSVFEKRVKEISKDKAGPSPEILKILTEYVDAPRTTHEQVRKQSIEKKQSIVAAVVEAGGISASTMNEEQHELAVEYFSAQLALRDRRMGVNAMIKEEPDLLSDLVRATIPAMEPMLQMLHASKFDLGQPVKLYKSYMEDLLKTAKVKKDKTPTIEDFVSMYQRQLSLTWKLAHDMYNKCPAMFDESSPLMAGMMEQFRRDPAVQENAYTEPKTGALGKPLLQMFDSLPSEKQQAVRQSLGAYATYMEELQTISSARLQEVLDHTRSTSHGPGFMIPRWHSLLDETLITPATISGSVRSGREAKLSRVSTSAAGKKKRGLFSKGSAGDSEVLADINVDSETAKGAMEQVHTAPDVKVVVDALGPSFKKLIMDEREMGLSGMAKALPAFVKIPGPTSVINGPQSPQIAV